MTSYDQTLSFLYEQLPAFSRIGPAAYKGSLDNTIALCQHLGNPEKKFKSIHIAGTNGKGSVSHMLASILQTAGYKTGLYTSPHLHDFRERFRIDGKMMDKDWVVAFVEKIRNQLPLIQPSFFEITVAMAFDWFAEQEVDIAVIETGMGGRLDSTNVLTPELSVITNIGWDHSNFLGDSLAKIAFEKAGIIKQQVPVVIGEVLPETLPVFESAADRANVPLVIASRHWQVADWRWEHGYLMVDVAEQNHSDQRHFKLDLPGLYQTRNLLTVLEACKQLRKLGWVLPDQVLHQALAEVRTRTGLSGRWQKIGSEPDIILDVAHNEPGMRLLVEQLELLNFHQLHIIIGMVSDKDPEPVLRLLPKQAHYFFTQASIPRAMPAKELQQRSAAFQLQGDCWPDVNAALSKAKELARPDDLILVCGSIFLVAEVHH
ncbi:MAG: bifunctional folylpolyglutamate synthase/dihydrofolate synthase [Chitinophagaceae bacterium]